MTLDIRALAILRIGLALVFLGDSFVRLSDVKAFYTNEGWLPLSVLHSGLYNDFALSFHAMSGSMIWQVLLIGLAILASIYMLFGHHTRKATIVCWVLLWSIQNRNPLILQGGDDFLRLCLFWAIFLPTAKIWSIDSRYLAKPQIFGHTHISNLGYVLLLFSVYFFSALMKYSDEWYIDGTALYYAFSLESMTYPLAKFIYPHYSLLKGLTFSAIFIELAAPFCLLIPYKTNFFRSIFLVLIFGLQLGISLTLQVGYFYLISMAAMLALLPTGLLDKIELLVNQIYIPKKDLDKEVVFSNFYSCKRIQGVAIFAILFSLVWNAGNLKSFPPQIKKIIKPIGTITRLSQNWGMFAPTVYKADGWFVYKAQEDSGAVIDIIAPNSKLTYAKPEWPVYQYKNAKWRKLGENLIKDKNKKVRTTFCRYQLLDYNMKHKQSPIKKLEIIYLREMSLPNYATAVADTGRICNCSIKL